MKKRFCAIAVSVVLLVITIMVINNSEGMHKNSANDKRDIVPHLTESNKGNIPSSGNNFKVETDVRYMIVMEQNYLRTYKIENEKKLLLRQSEISPLLMTEREVQKLRNGIHSDNLEEIYLYYESYAS